MLKKLIPCLQVSTIYDLNLVELKQKGLKGIIVDLDNTLVGAKEPLATPPLIEWLQRVYEHEFQIVIVSNNNNERVSSFAEPLQLPFIHSAKKPFNTSFNKALSLMNLAAADVAVVGDQMLTDVLGGNRLGLFTILVKPIAKDDEGFWTRINRRIEKWALRKMKRKGLKQEEH